MSMALLETDVAAQDERAQARWDSFCGQLPTCTRCGYPILSPLLLYIPEHDEYYCKDCVDAMTQFNENLEVT